MSMACQRTTPGVAVLGVDYQGRSPADAPPLAFFLFCSGGDW